MNNLVDGCAFSFKIKKDKEETLRALLKQVHEERNKPNGIIPFTRATHLHYTSLVMLPEETGPNLKLLPRRLLLFTTFTGNRRHHLRELLSLNTSAWRNIFSCCDESHAESIPDQSLMHFVMRHRISNTVYNAFQYFLKEDIVKEEELRESIEEFLDEASADPGFKSLSATAIRERIQSFVKSQPKFEWASIPFRIGLFNYLKWNYKRWLLLTGIVFLPIISLLSLFIHSPILAIIAIIFISILLLLVVMFLLLRINERNRDPNPIPSDDHIFEITSKEKAIVTNEMSVIGPVKRAWIRHIFLGFILQALKPLRPILYIPTVHTARWLTTDRLNRLVFISYFDNTSEAYANDFVDSEKRNPRINLVFGNGYGFPPTKYLIKEGGKDRRGYMNVVRNNQRITNVWYSSHERLSIMNVINNRAIRKGLWGKMKEEEIKKWLLHF